MWKTKDTMTNNFLTLDFKTFVLPRLSVSIKSLPNGIQYDHIWKSSNFFAVNPTAKICHFKKYLKFGTCADHDDIHSSIFALLGPN